MTAMLSACRSHDTATIAENAATPPPMESVVRQGWRFTARLAGEEPVAGLAAAGDRRVVFGARRISLDEKTTLRAEDLGIPGGVLDAAMLDVERLLVVGASCANCEAAKPVGVIVDRAGKATYGAAGDAFMKSAARARIATGVGDAAGVVFEDSSGVVRFAPWSASRGWGGSATVDTGARTVSLALDPATGEPLIAGIWNGQIAVWTRGADGAFTRVVLGRPAKSRPDHPPIALAPPGRPLAVVAPSTEVLGSEALYYYARDERGWTASKIAFTSPALAYDAVVGNDGAPWLAIREATNAALFDLRDLNASPRVIPEAGGNGPVSLAVDEAGAAAIALWTKGRAVLVTRDAGN